MSNLLSGSARKEVKIPIIEVFGPVIQGEGAMIGKQTSFIRTGGCDYRCTHCDTLFAVLPHEVKKNSTRMSPQEVIDLVTKDPNNSKAPWVTLSGGNPAMWDFSEVIDGLHEAGYKVAIETQGSLFNRWIISCDQITISPKGPGMMPNQEEVWNEVMTFFDQLDEALANGGFEGYNKVCIKVPVFAGDVLNRDLDFAESLATDASTREFPLYLSLGNYYTPEGIKEKFPQLAHVDPAYINERRMEDYRTIADALALRPKLRHAIFLPQLHVLAWGNARSK